MISVMCGSLSFRDQTQGEDRGGLRRNSLKGLEAGATDCT